MSLKNQAWPGRYLARWHTHEGWQHLPVEVLGLAHGQVDGSWWYVVRRVGERKCRTVPRVFPQDDESGAEVQARLAARRLRVEVERG